jgi:hypothetical protein
MRLLVFCHNHPDLQPGGTEAVARGVFRALRDRHGVEGLFLAAVTGQHRERRPGTLFQAAGRHPDELLVWLSHFDRYHLAQLDTWGLAELLPSSRATSPTSSTSTTSSISGWRRSISSAARRRRRRSSSRCTTSSRSARRRASS